MTYQNQIKKGFQTQSRSKSKRKSKKKVPKITQDFVHIMYGIDKVMKSEDRHIRITLFLTIGVTRITQNYPNTRHHNQAAVGDRSELIVLWISNNIGRNDYL